ncbi:DUF1104 domain-containing protein [Helicobacter sp. 23-1044]
MKILRSILAVTIASGALFATDFSKSSNDELLNLAGKIKAEEAKDYFAEIEKRVDEMTGKEAREFREKFHANEQKVFDNMKMKDIRTYKQSLAGARGGKLHGFGECGGNFGTPFDKGSKGAKGTKGAKGERSKGQGRVNCGANCNPPAPPAK